MPAPFGEVAYNPDSTCAICNTAGETFVVDKSLEACPACLVLVARARAGAGAASTSPRTPPKLKNKTRSSSAELGEKSIPTPMPADSAEPTSIIIDPTP
jgi:hypothetical protein